MFRRSSNNFLSTEEQYCVTQAEVSVPCSHRNSQWKIWRSQWKQQQCISRCSHIHCLLPHMGMFSLCLCPCVSRQDILNYFAQLPPWTLATARQYTHHADTRTYSYREHSSCPSHTRILDTYRSLRKKYTASGYMGDFFRLFRLWNVIKKCTICYLYKCLSLNTPLFEKAFM